MGERECFFFGVLVVHVKKTNYVMFLRTVHMQVM